MTDEENPTPDLTPETATAAEPTLEESFKKLQAERDSLYDQLVRRQADFENYRKRVERGQQEFRHQAEADLILALLPVLDGFERALGAPTETSGQEAFGRGVELICKQLLETLTRRGLKPVKALGETFDPFLHHALEKIETTEFRDQEVIEELQRGYSFKQRLLRPALVKVAVRPRQAGESGDSEPAKESKKTKPET